MFLIPKPGLIVIDPATHKALPAEGKTVVGDASYWHRRLIDKDVTAGGAPQSSAAPVKPPAGKSPAAK
ncbi:DUF2635 domain-containing protein [Ferrovibrio xuzhouensis]|uniref:DUF2635 domain-containing protein n=1 Tax=Ferrovibrio xuzhouensis TaxID=1576914 RepID=A0ABV7VCZ2_9PROT